MIKQVVYFNVPPQKVYDTLLDEDIHAKFTGSRAKINKEIGGKFSVWDDYASGENKELIPGGKIVQTWRASDWPEDVYSTVTFEFYPHDKGTELVFKHEGVPKDQEDDISKGWANYYWKPLEKYFSQLSD